jgi:MFS family permease
MLRALRYRNYRLYFGGQLISLVGTWLTTVATSWLVYRLANRDMPDRVAFILGVVGFAAQLPVFLVSPAAGVLVDRWNRHRILVVTQTLSMFQSFALAGLTLSGIITIPQIILLNMFQGLVNALDMPARQSLVVELVENREDLSNAIALTSSTVHAARLIGPAVAGALIYQFGEGICFLIDGFSYLAVIVALLVMRLHRPIVETKFAHPWLAFKEGLAYAFGFRPIRTLLVLVAVISLGSMSQSVLMPIFAAQVLHGQEMTLGLLLGSSGCGALIGSLYLASRRTVVGLGRVIMLACCVLGLGLIGFAASRWLGLSMAVLLAVGGSLVVLLASCNTLLQTIVEDDKRGRVMSLFSTAFMGMAPFGSMLAGLVANAIGAQWTLVIAGGVCLGCGVVFGLKLPAIRTLVRPIYVQKGILPEMAAGMRSTAAMNASLRD